jgi:hypothetical protein
MRIFPFARLKVIKLTDAFSAACRTAFAGFAPSARNVRRNTAALSIALIGSIIQRAPLAAFVVFRVLVVVAGWILAVLAGAASREN